MNQALSPPTGLLFGDRYRTTQLLAAGGMGSVYAAEDARTGRGVAVKVLHQRLADREQTVERFRREAQLLYRIDHPGVVRILDCGLGTDGRVFLVMELLEGETLSSMMSRGPVAAHQLVAIVDGIADVLEAIHRAGLVHRDLKPSNVFLTGSPGVSGTCEVKLIDFGVAKAIQLARLTATGEMLGTPRFMAPEQLRTPHAVDHRADVFALGVLTYTALAGKPPYPDEPAAAIAATLEGRVFPLQSFVPDAPAAVARILENALSVDPGNRPASAPAFAQAFRLAALPTTGATEAPIARTVRLDAQSLPAAPPPSVPATVGLVPSVVPAQPAHSSRPSLAATAERDRHSSTPKLVAAGLVLALLGAAALGGVLLIRSRERPEVSDGTAEPPAAQSVSSPPPAAAPPPAEAAPPAPAEQAPAEAPAVVAARSTVTLTSEPPRAMVRDGDIVVGSTPLAVPRPDEGRQRYSLALPGYREAIVSVGPRSPDAVSVDLVRQRRRRPETTHRRPEVEAPAEVPTAAPVEPAPVEPAPPATAVPIPLEGTEVVCPFDPETCASISATRRAQ